MKLKRKRCNNFQLHRFPFEMIQLLHGGSLGYVREFTSLYIPIPYTHPDRWKHAAKNGGIYAKSYLLLLLLAFSFGCRVVKVCQNKVIRKKALILSGSIRMGTPSPILLLPPNKISSLC